jgi:hypothetical protein
MAFLDPFFENEGLHTFAVMYGSASPRDFLREVENNLRLTFPWAHGRHAVRQFLTTAVYADNALMVSLLGFACERSFFGYDENFIWGPLETLNRDLLESGSIWQVASAETGLRLERRVLDETAAAMRRAQDPPGNASSHLRDAVAAAYGRSPNASEAYRQAVKAVEALAVQLVEPNNAAATLGSAIGTLRANHTHFDTIVVNSAERIGEPVAIDLSGFDTALALMHILWRNQTDRHSPGDTHAVVPITQEQAEWAVQTAVYLVEMLRQSWLRRL